KDRFDIHLGADLDAGSITCPGGVTAPIRPARAGGGTAYFASACPDCPLRAQCTTAASGRTVSVGPYEQTLTDARARQTDPAWTADYRATRPKVERKLGHLVRRHHGGRRARVRGTVRVDADFRLLAGAVNLARLAMLGCAEPPKDGQWRRDQQRENPSPRAHRRDRRAKQLLKRFHRTATRPDLSEPKEPYEPPAEPATLPKRPYDTSHLGPCRLPRALRAARAGRVLLQRHL